MFSPRCIPHTTRAQHHRRQKTERTGPVSGLRREGIGTRFSAEGTGAGVRSVVADLAQHVEPDQVIEANRRQAGSTDRDAMRQARGMAGSTTKRCEAVRGRGSLPRAGAGRMARHQQRRPQELARSDEESNRGSPSSCPRAQVGRALPGDVEWRRRPALSSRPWSRHFAAACRRSVDRSSQPACKDDQ
jgi:hypothetical protein